MSDEDVARATKVSRRKERRSKMIGTELSKAGLFRTWYTALLNGQLLSTERLATGVRGMPCAGLVPRLAPRPHRWIVPCN